MHFSVGILYSSYDFLKFLRHTPGIKKNFPEVMKSFNNLASPQAILEICQDCNWTRLTVTGDLEVTEKGERLLEISNIEKVLRTQISDFIETYKPHWISLFSKGRTEAIKYLEPDIVQCLRDAELLVPISDEVINWWDNTSRISRKKAKDERLDIGRKGEKLSLTFERERTKKEPIWKGFESNLCGYDILSVKEINDIGALLIESKSSNLDWRWAKFHLSKNEWEVAQNSSNYIFHLWLLSQNPRLYIVKKKAILTHIPKNYGEGIWLDVEIPFSSVTIENSFLTWN